jgi:glycosyltransferase involved in cell wall biosynthesis
MHTETLLIDVAMPTYLSEPVLASTLQHLALSEQAGPVTIDTFRVIDNESDDRTLSIVEERAEHYGWDTDIISRQCSLPAARQLAIERVETDWFLFLDDDVRITESYLEDHASTIAPRIGAIQGRKLFETTVGTPEPGPARRSTEAHPSEWVHRRAFRGGTHATLIRREAAAPVEFPADLNVWEDQYLRREIERSGYLWIFNHQARFAHVTQNPRPQGWSEGYVQGKYGLRPAWHTCMGIPYAVVSEFALGAAIKQVAGYAAGRIGVLNA